MSDEDLKQLASMIDNMDSSLDNPSEWSQLNKEMHLYICHKANTKLVYKMMEKVLDHWDRLRFHYLRDVFSNRFHDAQRQHKQILQAFYECDHDKLEQVIHEHNQSALTSYIQYLQSAGHLTVDEEHDND